MDLYSVYLKHPFTMMIAGPSGSGKTHFISRLISDCALFSHPKPEKITYFYSEFQQNFVSMPNVNFIQGISDNVMKSFDGSRPEWLVIDDLMHETVNSKIVSELFTKGSHHRNLSVIILVQNFFTRGIESRNISLNSHYIVLFKNPRDQSIASMIARQMFPRNIKKFQEIFQDATSEPFSYLFIDLKSDTPEEIRLLTNICGEKEYITAYQI